MPETEQPRLRIAGAEITFNGNLTLTQYPHGMVKAWPQDNEAYRKRAFDLGYDQDTALMSREHEIAHHLLAHALDLPHSPTLWAIAGGRVYGSWMLEEAAVLALQAFTRAKEIDLVAAARKLVENYR